MLLGGLIGSLLFGGLDAFSGINFIDILVIGLILFLIFRFVRSRRLAAQPVGPVAAQGPPYGGTEDRPELILHRTSPSAPSGSASTSSGEKSAWDTLNSAPSGAPSPGVSIPEGFDVDEFLSGAKAAYTRLQQSWNNRDIDDIRNFTTREVFAEIKRQQASAPMLGQTELIQVDASLLEVREEGEDTVCSVLFDVLLREDSSSPQPSQIQEIWHFSRPSSGQGVWLLEGIQQVE
jgi:predicted lipid-binding transport protein (Tim44 family)